MKPVAIHLSPTETARRFGVSIKALRLYESRGLLKPLRSQAGWRTYGPDQIAGCTRSWRSSAWVCRWPHRPASGVGRYAWTRVLGLQDQALVREGRRIARALALIRAARAKLKTGQALSIDDLATLSKETSMTSKLTRPTLFHPALVPHQHKYFRPEEIDALASQEGFDQEKDYRRSGKPMIAELKTLTAAGDPAAPAAQDLARRWIAQTESFHQGRSDPNHQAAQHDQGRLRRSGDGGADALFAKSI